jgi:diacylglycerol O-acyltransferase
VVGVTGGPPDREVLSGPDNSWLRMGDRTNLMTITGLLYFDDPVSYEAVREQLTERLLPFKRFRQRVVNETTPFRRPTWVLDEQFDIDCHLHHVALPEPQGKAEFQSFVGDLLSQPVDHDKPLWQAYLVEGAGDGNALVMRIHHALGDGFAMMYVLLGLADDPSEIDLPVGGAPSPPDHATDGSASSVSSDRSPGSDADDGPSVLGALSAAPSMLVRGARAAKVGIESMTLPEEPDNALHGDLGLKKRAAWTEPIDVDRAKAVGREFDGTINDVLLATTTGALRRYLEEHDGHVDPDAEHRTAIPVNLKPLDRRDEQLGNAFGLGFLQLPVGIDSVQGRIDEISSRTGALRQGTQAWLMLTLLKTVGNLPMPFQDAALWRFRNRASSVITNVPGPTDAFHFAGSEVSDMMFWVPTSQGIGLGISIYSYDGHVRVGIASDAGLVDDPTELTEAFVDEFEAIATRVGVDPVPADD